MELPKKTLWTIGHSTRPLPTFVELLKHYRIHILADVRSLPGSRKYPQFNKENLEIELPAIGISYRHFPGLGGRRKVHKDSKNIAWRNNSFRGYADYMETTEFEKAIDELTGLSRSENTCIMCAEAVWWRCHRSMIADYLKMKGWTVIHILSLDKAEEHPYTSPATVKEGKLSYE